jgi:hypothetical protein
VRASGREQDRSMRPLLLIPAVVLALLLPGSASARPILDPPINTPAPTASAPPALAAPQDEQSPVGYVLVGLGGLALGAGASLTLRRVAA